MAMLTAVAGMRQVGTCTGVRKQADSSSSSGREDNPQNENGVHHH